MWRSPEESNLHDTLVQVFSVLLLQNHVPRHPVILLNSTLTKTHNVVRLNVWDTWDFFLSLIGFVFSSSTHWSDASAGFYEVKSLAFLLMHQHSDIKMFILCLKYWFWSLYWPFLELLGCLCSNTLYKESLQLFRNVMLFQNWHILHPIL